MANVGIIGIGFMGNMHFGVYKASDKARVVAIADIDEKKLAGDWSAIAGNIGDPSAKSVDLTGISTYRDPEDLIADPNVEVIDVCTPPRSHARWVIAALDEGKSVICEKPIALSLEDAQKMIVAAEGSDGNLYVAHCIRFWPEYAAAKRIIDEGEYGKVNSATFRRVGATPTWGWQNWFLDPERSGGAITDLHIHDVDFINYVFGIPKAVFARGVVGAISENGIDQIIAEFIYDDGPVVSAEGTWFSGKNAPFSMTFTIELEGATLDFSAGNPLTVYPKDGEANVVEVGEGDGYSLEIEHFLDCIAAGKPSEIISPEDAAAALRVIEAEKESVKTGQVIEIG